MQGFQKKIGDRIRQLRKQRGWSQEGFADLCHVHRSYMGAVERGEVNLTIQTLKNLTAVLDTTISALFKGIA